MTFLSYSAGAEDAVLWRALRHVAAGTYVDVGATDADRGSVTRAFYDRGWRGTNLAATVEAAARLSAARPLDRTLPCSAGMSLAGLCGPGPVHFLRIAPEQPAGPVLAGLGALRPWVVLAGAAGLAGWEPALLAAGYRFTWAEGVNRFYLAAGQAGLADAFRIPAEDVQFAHHPDAALRERLDEALLDVREARERVEQLVLRAARESAAQARADAPNRSAHRIVADGGIPAFRQAIAAVQAERDHLSRHLAHVEADRAAARALLEATYGSTSWRVTAPIRRVRQVMNRGNAVPAPAVLEAPAPSSAAPVLPATAPAVPPMRAVHQFHSGSAVGDAITNGMLLTRSLLRQLGFRSEIYVQHRPDTLARELRLVDELPDHAGYVLLLHHSIGHDVLHQVLGLPAPKVLVYHNITPPEHLLEPTLRRYAAIGREQLDTLRPFVTGALADSAFNALELRDRGFDPVQACPLLFDVDALREGRDARDPAAPFTVLFVGRVIDSKGQLELVEAFARFAGLFDHAARLVLVGGFGDLAYVQSVEGAVRRLGLSGQVVLTGAVPDAVRDDWYDAADLYVSLSRHEGFGVPLVEAMARQVPVLAWSVGAVAATVGDGGELLDDPGPTAVARRMLALATDPARRTALGKAGRRSLERFELGRHLPRLQEALLRAGAAAPPDLVTRDGLRRSLRYAVTGHANKAYSLAAVNRSLALALEAERPGRVRFLPVEGSPTTDLGGVPAPQREAIGALAGRPPPVAGTEVVISQHYPVFVPAARARVQLALFFWEESAIPQDTIDTLGASFDAVLAPSRFVRKALIDSGLTVPVRLVGQAPDLSAFAALAEARTPRTQGPFTFLHVSSCFPRKGLDVLLSAWAAAFTARDPVRLVIKAFANPHNDAAEQIARMEDAHPHAAPVVLIDEEMDDAALLALFADADAMVLPTRGEGFNLPALEALAAGLPLIVTGFGGHRDFCGPDEARLIDYSFAPSRSHLASPASVWVEPDTADLARALRELVSDPASARVRAEAGRLRAARAADRGALAARLDEVVLDAMLQPAPGPARVAWVSTWNVRCGVAEYSRHMLNNLPRDGIELLVLADDRTPPGDAPRVRSPWRPGTPASLSTLMAAIRREDAHVVVVQHQPGLLDWPTLERTLRAVEDDGRLAVVALHNTRHLLDQEPVLKDVVLQALRDAARVLVHTMADLNRLKEAGVVDNVTLLPHGAMPAHPTYHPRKLDPATDAPVIGSTGFFLPGKGLPQLVEALGVLRRTWPHARLQLTNAVYDSPVSAQEIATCRDLAERLGLTDAVEFITDFLPHERCMELLGRCDLLALTYQSSMEASSAALRTAFASGVAVAVTPLPLFAEEGASVITLPGTAPAEIAAGLSAALHDPRGCWRVAEDAHYWMLARAWPGVGRRLAGLLRGLHASHPPSPGPVAVR